ncbi:MAG TPA: BlaI/MecI/CopY family transcriptional regulator, partial [Phenylobacterium sp.]|nr:BlaI/MecI/CopY family transcriptional regulator [Phenylobacterium sp.]
MLTPLELQIMQVLWDGGPGTVAAVQEKLGSDLAYTTVQTMLTVLLRKKKVRRTQAGRAFTYQAAISREGAVGATVTDLVSRMFGGSGEARATCSGVICLVSISAISSASRLVNGDDEEG